MNSIHSFLQNANGQHLDSIYLPSVARYVLFKPITISLAKTITRIDMFKGFDINIELTKLSLFDTLIAENLSLLNINSATITEIDYLAFVIGVRHLLSTELTFKCNCDVCKNEFTSILNQAQTIDPLIQQSKLIETTYERYDANNNLWKFDLKDYTMKDYLLFKHMINELKEIDEKNKDVQNNGDLIKPVLYIKNIYLNDEKIDDWESMSLIEKIKFFNNIPASITISNSTGDCLYLFIHRTFASELIKQQIKDLKIVCPSCKTEYHGVYDYNDMFFILGLPEDNQEIFKNIFNTEAQLIFNRWLTVSEINKMSYLDFKMYSEIIFNMEEERLEREEEALNAAQNDTFSFQ